MADILAQISPQRSTQYAALATTLAPREFELSAVAPAIAGLATIQIGNQAYVKCSLARPLTPAELREMGGFACTSAYFDYFAELGGEPGPFLRPINTTAQDAWPDELVQARRYRGKTNELFTRFLCNIARHSSSFANAPWSELRVLDPLAGGATTLFTALTLGASAYGVEKTGDDVSLAATFMRQFCNEAGTRFVEKRSGSRASDGASSLRLARSSLCWPAATPPTRRACSMPTKKRT